MNVFLLEVIFTRVNGSESVKVMQKRFIVLKTVGLLLSN